MQPQQEVRTVDTMAVIVTDILLKGNPRSPELEGSIMNISDHDENPDTHEKTYLRDITKPFGDACRADGTLKDANEMDWVTSPTANEGPGNNFHELDNCEDMYVPPDYPDESDLDENDLQSIQVSFINAVI
jgi:hypothetical protein